MRRFLCPRLGSIAIATTVVVWLFLGTTAWTAEPSPAAAEAAKPADAAKPAAEPSKPAAEAPAAAPAASQPRKEAAKDSSEAKSVKIRFSFRFQPWKDVLDWFARKADLSLMADVAPSGTFNYTDDREYSPAEAIDLLNKVLFTKGFMLVRSGRMLMLISTEDPIPLNLISPVPLAELDKHGESEMVCVLFNLEQLKPEEAETEVKKLLGPQGSVLSLVKSRRSSSPARRDGCGWRATCCRGSKGRWTAAAAPLPARPNCRSIPSRDQIRNRCSRL